jgi:hypothetical protein
MAAFIVGEGFGMDFRMPSLPFMDSRPSMNSALEMITIQIPDLNTLVRRTCLWFEFGNKEICFATISWTRSLLLEVAFFLPHFFCGFKSVPLLFLTEQQHRFMMVVENLFCGSMSIASLYFKGVCQQAIQNSTPTLFAT